MTTDDQSGVTPDRGQQERTDQWDIWTIAILLVTASIVAMTVLFLVDTL